MNVSWLINVLFNEFLMLYYFEKILEQKQLIGELISENNRFCNRKELILIYLKFGHEPPFMVCGLFPLNCTLIFSEWQHKSFIYSSLFKRKIWKIIYTKLKVICITNK
nr:PREDICTED: uncharacterized protein LOC107398527 isoform X1 [Tribolium castaneum]|eukprot:XP_015838340.1 PREDICTED: uncharacterized protein LOC107398527 isoform X1 [Tribolium castaneum]